MKHYKYRFHVNLKGEITGTCETLDEMGTSSTQEKDKKFLANKHGLSQEDIKRISNLYITRIYPENENSNTVIKQTNQKTSNSVEKNYNEDRKYNKTPEQIIAEAEADKIKYKLEKERRAQTEKANKEFIEGIKNNWKVISLITIVCIIGIIIFSYFNDVSKQDDFKLSLQLEQIEDQVKLAIKSGDKDKALELANKLVHESNSKMESQKFDTWNGYPKYDEYWTKKREFYKEQILEMSNSSKRVKSDVNYNSNFLKNIEKKDEIKVNSNNDLNNSTLYKINDPDGYSNLRSTPNGDVIKKVYETENFEIIGAENKFKKVKLLDGTVGYIHESRVVQAN